MKKLLALILSGIMLFALSGCGGAKDLQQEAAAPAETEAVAPEAEPQSTTCLLYTSGSRHHSAALRV